MHGINLALINMCVNKSIQKGIIVKYLTTSAIILLCLFIMWRCEKDATTNPDRGTRGSLIVKVSDVNVIPGNRSVVNFILTPQ